ncbi:MAG: NAD-dependent protein deacylase [Deltaproteobacteria bacterium]|nr:NAD-dependent protein deacylase [Deltaproteobacteria bacterium]MCL5277357.1 NAD-dependent protein deacylase [Deltaproteobacteria bacterium]
MLKKAAGEIVKRKHVVAFTGAGISQESGIATFRDAGGLWDRFSPAEFGTVEGIIGVAANTPQKLISFINDSIASLSKASPNPAHLAIAEMEKRGLLDCVITQNVDNLHQLAGNDNVIEVHGNIYRFRCTQCSETIKFSRHDFLEFLNRAVTELNSRSFERIIDAMPSCRCGGKARLDVVMFGEPVQMIPESYSKIEGAKVVLIVGTSGTVYPASEIPRYGKKSGAVIIDVNPKETFYADIDNYFLKGPAGVVMPQLMEEIRALL